MRHLQKEFVEAINKTIETVHKPADDVFKEMGPAVGKIKAKLEAQDWSSLGVSESCDEIDQKHQAERIVYASSLSQGLLALRNYERAKEKPDDVIIQYLLSVKEFALFLRDYPIDKGPFSECSEPEWSKSSSYDMLMKGMSAISSHMRKVFLQDLSMLHCSMASQCACRALNVAMPQLTSQEPSIDDVVEELVSVFNAATQSNMSEQPVFVPWHKSRCEAWRFVADALIAKDEDTTVTLSSPLSSESTIVSARVAMACNEFVLVYSAAVQIHVTSAKMETEKKPNPMKQMQTLLDLVPTCADLNVGLGQFKDAASKFASTHASSLHKFADQLLRTSTLQLLKASSKVAQTSLADCQPSFEKLAKLNLVAKLDHLNGVTDQFKKEVCQAVNGKDAKSFKDKFNTFRHCKLLPGALLNHLAQSGISQSHLEHAQGSIQILEETEVAKVQELIAHFAVFQSAFRTLRDDEDRSFHLKSAAACVVEMGAQPLPVKLQSLLGSHIGDVA